MEFCIAGSTDPRIVSYSNKQTTGVQITESDKDDLLKVYFDQCSPHYKAKFEQQEVFIKIHLVTYPGECKNTFDRIVNKVAMKTRGVREKLRIVGYIIAGIGLIGNLLCISVFCRPSYIATHRVSYYCLARSCSDNLMLIFCIISLYYYALEFSFKAGFDEVLESINEDKDYLVILQCAFVFAGFMTSEISSALLTLAISVERLISVVFPLKSKTYLTRQLARRVTFGVICISVLVPLVCFLAINVPVPVDFGSECLKFNKDPTSAEFLYFTIIWTVVVVLLPWITILVVTAITLWKLREASKRRQQMTSATSAAQNDPHRTTKLMSLVIAFSFIITLIPEIIINAFAILQASNLSQFYAAVHLNSVIIVLLAAKSSLSFFLCIATNERFRQIVLGYFKICFRCDRCANMH